MIYFRRDFFNGRSESCLFSHHDDEKERWDELRKAALPQDAKGFETNNQALEQMFPAAAYSRDQTHSGIDLVPEDAWNTQLSILALQHLFWLNELAFVLFFLMSPGISPLNA